MPASLIPAIALVSFGSLKEGDVFLRLSKSSPFFIKLALPEVGSQIAYSLMIQDRLISHDPDPQTPFSLADSFGDSEPVLHLGGALVADIEIEPSQIEAGAYNAPTGALLVGPNHKGFVFVTGGIRGMVDLQSFGFVTQAQAHYSVIKNWKLKLVQTLPAANGERDKSKDLTLFEVNIP